MRAFAWEELSGQSLPDGFTLQQVFEQTPHFALFRAHSTSESLQPQATVEVVSPQESPQAIVNRFMEASYLRHANLAGISAAGILGDRGLVYGIAEPVEHTLVEVNRKPLTPDAALELLDQITAGLAFIHSENLVFCNLRPEAIWRAASNWKLGDFSQLRVAGTGNSKDLRAALARRPDLPPEVYEGVVSPAWDVWSLGVLLRRMFTQTATPHTTAGAQPGRQSRPSELPAPFDRIMRDCLDPNPESRITLDQIRASLARSGSAPVGLYTSAGRPLPNRQADAPASKKNRFVSLLRNLPEQPSRVKALLSVIAAILLLAVLVSANSLLRHGGDESSTIATAPVPIVVTEADRAAPAPTPVQKAAASGEVVSGLPSNIKALLDKWVISTRTRDVQANLDCYAPFVESYYTKRQLSRKDMLREKQRQFATIGPVRRFELKNVQFTPVGSDRAVLLFDKLWAFGDRNPFSGSERAQLSLRKIAGAWKISAERELKVYWVRRGRQS